MSPGARATRAALAALAGILAAAPAEAFGPATNYALHCQGCHLDGRATPGLVPPLDAAVAGFALVPAGREYLVRLPNVASAPLDDAELAALLDWLVGRFGAPGIAAPPFLPADVGRLRARPLIDAERARAAAVRAGRDPAPGGAGRSLR